MVDECRSHRFRAIVRAPAQQGVSEVRRSLQRGLSSQRVLLLGPITGNVFRSVDLSRKPARDIEACLRSMSGKLYHMGLRGKVARSTLGDANEAHDWRIYADFAQILIGIARPLYARDPIGVDLAQSLYALDSTTIDLCLSLFPWAKFRKQKAPSRCTRCWTCTAIFPRLSALPTAKCTMSTSSTRSCRRLGRSTSWIADTWISNVFSSSRSARPSSSYAPNPT